MKSCTNTEYCWNSKLSFLALPETAEISCQDQKSFEELNMPFYLFIYLLTIGTIDPKGYKLKLKTGLSGTSSGVVLSLAVFFTLYHSYCIPLSCLLFMLLCIQCESKKIPPRDQTFFHFFHKRFIICNRFLHTY